MSTLVIAERPDSGATGLSRTTRQVVTAAQHWGQAVDLLLLGEVDAAAHAQIAGVRRVLHADAEHLKHAVAEDVTNLLETLVDQYSTIVSAHTTVARGALPRLAARRNVGMISEAVALLGPRTYQRPIYAGNLLATMENAPGLQLLTVRASRFAAADLDGKAEVQRIIAPAPDGRSRVTGRRRTGGERPELGQANVVVSGGRSLGSAEQFEAILTPLADRLAQLSEPLEPQSMQATHPTNGKLARQARWSHRICILPSAFPAPSSTRRASRTAK